MRSSSPASTSLYLDSEVLHNPFQAILPTLAVIVKPTTVGVSNWKIKLKSCVWLTRYQKTSFLI